MQSKWEIMIGFIVSSHLATKNWKYQRRRLKRWSSRRHMSERLIKRSLICGRWWEPATISVVSSLASLKNTQPCWFLPHYCATIIVLKTKECLFFGQKEASSLDFFIWQWWVTFVNQKDRFVFIVWVTGVGPENIQILDAFDMLGSDWRGPSNRQD